MISHSKTTKKYCCEPIENIENYLLAVNDQIRTWDCHHKDSIDKNMSRKELKEAGLYYGVPAERLIFIPSDEHLRLHRTGKKLSEESKRKVSKANAGRIPGNYIKVCPLQLYTMRKIKKLTWEQIANEIGASVPCIYSKWKRYNLDNFVINI